MAYDKAAYKLRGDFARLNFPNLRHNGSLVGGDFGEYKPLHSSVDAKLDAICRSLAENQKQGKPEKKKSRKVTEKATTTETCKVEVENESHSSPVMTETDGSAGSSPLSDLTFPDVTESSWGVAPENLVLEKYPSEIDWASIFS